MTRAPGISVSSLACSIGTARILGDVSFEIGDGEFASLIGPNGAGKTTLLRCLIKILPIEAGEVSIAGADIYTLGQKELARIAAYVPQADSRYLPLSVEEFVMTGRFPHLSPFTAYSARDREEVREALRMTGMEKFSSRRMSGLSGGERQLVMTAAALAQGAKVMLLDEPAAFLDPKHGKMVIDLLERINADRGVTILMVTHDINRAILSSSRCLVLDGGRVEFDGDPGELTSSGVLERVYGRRFEYLRHPSAGYDIILPDVRSDVQQA